MQKVKLKYSNYMKQLFIYSIAAVLSLTACSNDRELGGNDSQTQANAIGFQVIKKNVLVRSESTTIGSQTTVQLENAGHYNFGVFAYKNTDAINPIMSDYLVGYFGEGDSKVGYNVGLQTTLDGSRWAYESLGSSEYNYTGRDGYYTSDKADYMSNWPNQYLRYWDKSSNYTEFFAYAPYLNKSRLASATEEHLVSISGVGASSTTTLTFADGSIQAGYEQSLNEYMYAYTKVENSSYSRNNPDKVQLQFKRLTAKVNIAFYEEIDGYNVTILNLKEYATNPIKGVCAAPAVRSGDSEPYTYTYGTVYKNSGLTIKFAEPADITWQNQVPLRSEHLIFAVPSGPIKDANTSPTDPATKSNTTYYAIPRTETNTGLTFHITYKLTSTTGETITVHNATVHVPAEYCQWEANHGYTYVFKITKNSTGSTDTPSVIDPNDPEVGEQALYPIIFANCTVVDWETERTQEYNVN